MTYEMNTDSKIMVAGSNGMVGRAIVRTLRAQGYKNIFEASRAVVDFTNQEATDTIFRLVKPEYVFVASAKVGGILANKTYKADFLLQNLRIQNNIIDSACSWKVKKLLFLGSSCIYPKNATQPITEDQLLTGPLEDTNDAYAIAKIAGIKLCQALREQNGFNAISIMPCNLYGPYDNFDLQSSHVLPALIAKFHKAKVNNESYVLCWGNGTPLREFLYVDDLAEACLVCMESYNDSEIINVGSGRDLTIADLAHKVAQVVEYDGKIGWDHQDLNGTPRKVLEVSKIKALGWEPKVGLLNGIDRTYQWYLNNVVI